jgi:hypothetical protein
MVRDQEVSHPVPFVPVGWGRRLQRIEGKSLTLVLVVSISTAPTIHLPDGWKLNKNTREQKGARKPDDPVRALVFSGASDSRILQNVADNRREDMNDRVSRFAQTLNYSMR